MSKVLVVNPPNKPYTERSLLIEPIDVLTVASHIRSLGNDVKVIDMDVKQREPESISEELQTFQPDFTVMPFDYHIPLFRHDAIPGVNRIAQLADASGSRVILGGRTPKHYGEMFLDGAHGVVISGEMEPALTELFDSNWSDSSLEKIAGISYKTNGVLHRTAPRKERFDLNQLSIPDRSLVDMNDYIDVRTLLSSRGCVEKCGFCPVPEFWGHWKKRDPVKVVDEIEYLVKEFGAKKILFLDDHAIVDRKRMINISDEIIRRGIETTLGCLGTVSRYDPEMMETMHGAGFRWIHYGAEMASQKVLDYMNKGITVDEMKEAIVGTRKAGMRVRTSWIFDAPQADEKALDDTVELILDTEPEEIRAHYLTLRAGTPFERQVEARGKYSLPIQYIHSGKPHSGFDTLSPEKVLERVEYLTDQLQSKGYLVVRDPSQFRTFDENKDQDSRVISFCPLRYGIGWRR